MECQPTSAARQPAKRPRSGVSFLSDSDDVDTPDLAEFQRSFDLTDSEMIKLCVSYASYLKAALRRRR